MTKPHIFWAPVYRRWCCATSLFRCGFGKTPAEAYADWRALRC